MRVPFPIPPPGSKLFDLAGFGLNSVDLLTVVGEYPTSNSKQRLQRFATMPGGQIATAMATAQRLGWRTRYVGSFGDDEFGAFSRESLLREGVDLTAARTVVGATNQFAVVLVDARTGERTVLWDRHPALTMQPEEVPRDAVISGRLLIVDCHETSAATQAATYAREAGVTDHDRRREGPAGHRRPAAADRRDHRGAGFSHRADRLRRSGPRDRSAWTGVWRGDGDGDAGRGGKSDLVRWTPYPFASLQGRLRRHAPVQAMCFAGRWRPRVLPTLKAKSKTRSPSPTPRPH